MISEPLTTDEVLNSCDKLVEEFGAENVKEVVERNIVGISGRVITQEQQDRISKLKQKCSF